MDTVRRLKAVVERTLHCIAFMQVKITANNIDNSRDTKHPSYSLCHKISFSLASNKVMHSQESITSIPLSAMQQNHAANSCGRGSGNCASEHKIQEVEQFSLVFTLFLNKCLEATFLLN